MENTHKPLSGDFPGFAFCALKVLEEIICWNSLTPQRACSKNTAIVEVRNAMLLNHHQLLTAIFQMNQPCVDSGM